MIIPPQRTINSKVSCDGVGIHSGAYSLISLSPAPCDTGIVFRRTDIASVNGIVPAKYSNVITTNLGTTIANKSNVKISTIEHLMAAIWGCGIDNLYIDINGPEIPIMDGSSGPFVFLIECAGMVEQEKSRKFIEIIENFEIFDGDKYIKIKPSKEFYIDLQIDFNHQKIRQQSFSYRPETMSFKNDICRARTFGFKHEIEKLREHGLAKGGTLNNAILVDEKGVVNIEGLRYEDEFVRHKTLDFVGDIYLAQANIIGHFEVNKSGHSLNNKMLHSLIEDKNKWRLI